MDSIIFSPRGERERKIRSIFKTVSWRCISITTTFLTAWFLTKNLTLSFTLTGVREIFAFLLYYGHERIWNGIKWGKFRLEKLAKSELRKD